MQVISESMARRGELLSDGDSLCRSFRWSETPLTQQSTSGPSTASLPRTFSGNAGERMKLSTSLLVACWCFGWCVAVNAAEHSIMEIIDKERVKKLIAQQRANVSRESLPAPFTTNSVSDYSPGSESYIPRRINERQGTPPDMASVLSAIGRPDQVLESDSGMLITKKKYLKKDWCRTEPVIQTIREQGCLPKNIVNRFCYGQCNSFFIPMNISGGRGKKKRPDEWEETTVFRSCGVCRPKKSAWVLVTLECPGTGSPLRRRRVHKVKQCQCLAANV